MRLAKKYHFPKMKISRFSLLLILSSFPALCFIYYSALYQYVVDVDTNDRLTLRQKLQMKGNILHSPSAFEFYTLHGKISQQSSVVVHENDNYYHVINGQAEKHNPANQNSASSTKGQFDIPKRLALSGCTIVTALLDIGRGNWSHYRRPIGSYLTYMERVLRLKTKLLIFTDPVTFRVIKKARQMYGLTEHTFIKVIRLEELPYYKFMGRIKSIIDREQNFWRPDWDPSMKLHPESFSAEYLLLMNSKLFMIQYALKLNPFQSSHFYWLDAGYGHGKSEVVFPAQFTAASELWCPKKSLTTMIKSSSIDESSMNNNQNKATLAKVTLLSLTPDLDIRQDELTLKKLYRTGLTLIIGSFFGGPLEAMDKLYELYDQIFRRLLLNREIGGVVDDDQTLLALCYAEKPGLFSLVYSDWYDVFKLFK